MTSATSPLLMLSPVDGRYANKTSSLQPVCSEYGLMKYRIKVELEWFKHLCAQKQLLELPPLADSTQQALDDIYHQFDQAQAERVKTIEQTTNHDLKAIEYYLKEQFKRIGLEHQQEFLHFACTSEDINNLAYALMLKEAKEKVLMPSLEHVTQLISQLAHQHADVPMMARTHGQPASPTTLGKEMANVAFRLHRQIIQFKEQTILGKINGAVGNFNAHLSAYPQLDWPQISQTFIESLGLSFNAFTTQIEPHDWIAEYLQVLMRIHTILIDLDRDIWGYISLGYFIQKTKAGEVGSSTMPHKVNPIDFENSEGNLGIANAIMAHLSTALPISRFQRDLTDSTRLRNLGTALGHALVAYQATAKGLASLEVNTQQLASDLNQHWVLLAEPIQTVMRRYGIAEPYETLKAFTRGKALDKTQLQEFIQQLELPSEAKAQLLALTPDTYLGNAAQQAQSLNNIISAQ